jgi:hypothetical protein
MLIKAVSVACDDCVSVVAMYRIVPHRAVDALVTQVAFSSAQD